MDSQTNSVSCVVRDNQQLYQRQIVIPFLLLILCSLIAGGGYIYLTTEALNQQELTQTTHLANSAMAVELAELSNWSKDYGFWDDTNRHVVERFDRDWANNNIGQYLYDSFDIHQSYAISADNRTIIGYQDGEELAEIDLLAAFPPEIQILLEQTRASPPQDPQAASGILQYNGKTLLVAASVITPERPGPDIRSDLPRPVLVLVRLLDEELLAKMADRYLLKELQLDRSTTATEFGVSDFRDPAGKVLGQLHWQLRNPGTSSLSDFSSVKC